MTRYVLLKTLVRRIASLVEKLQCINLTVVHNLTTLTFNVKSADAILTGGIKMRWMPVIAIITFVVLFVAEFGV